MRKTEEDDKEKDGEEEKEKDERRRMLGLDESVRFLTFTHTSVSFTALG